MRFQVTHRGNDKINENYTTTEGQNPAVCVPCGGALTGRSR